MSHTANPTTTLDWTDNSPEPEVPSNCPSLAAGGVAALVVVSVVALLLFLFCLYMFMTGKRKKQGLVEAVEHRTSRQDKRHTSGLSVDSNLFRDTLREDDSNVASLLTSPIQRGCRNSRSSMDNIQIQIPTIQGLCCSTPGPAGLEQLQEINEGFNSTTSLESLNLDISRILSQEGEQGSLLGSIFEELGNEISGAVSSSFYGMPFNPFPLSVYKRAPSIAGDNTLASVKTSTLSSEASNKLHQGSPVNFEANSSTEDSPCVPGTTKDLLA